MLLDLKPNMMQTSAPDLEHTPKLHMYLERSTDDGCNCGKKKQMSTCPALLEGLKLAAYRHNCINETHVHSFLRRVKPC